MPFQLSKWIMSLPKVEMLNLYDPSQNQVDDTNKDLPYLDQASHALESTIIISSQDVKDILHHLNASKVSRADLISPRLLKEGANILALPYSIVFNRSLDQGYFPNSWKEANISPIYKTMKSLFQVTTGQYLSYAKMEKQWNDVSIRIASYQILTPFQSGFVPGDSTTCKLLHTYHMFGEAVDNSKEVRTVFCDISKAFDQVWHKGLLHKLRGIGCSGNVLAWFSGRKQRVVINGKFQNGSKY